MFRATYAPEGGFERPAAVKKILPAYAEDAEFIALFRREAELAAQLHHPNVIQLFDAGRSGDSYFLAMEFVDGLPLHKLIRQHPGPMPLPAATFVAFELCAALEYVHELRSPDGAPLRLIHRDLNPPNVLISKSGDVKLADFGIARSRLATAITTTGAVRGKNGYMPPEQLRGGSLDPRADLYALGCTLWEMLAGSRLFEGDDDLAVQRAVMRHAVPRVSERRADVPRAPDELVQSLLEPSRDRRPASAAEVRVALLGLEPKANPLPEGRELLIASVRRAFTSGAEAGEVPFSERATVGQPSDVVATRSLAGMSKLT